MPGYKTHCWDSRSLLMLNIANTQEAWLHAHLPSLPETWGIQDTPWGGGGGGGGVEKGGCKSTLIRTHSCNPLVQYIM